MKEMFTRLAQYNAWANGVFCTMLQRMDDARLDAEIPSSFPTIRRTVAHVRGAEAVWLQRLQLAERPLWLGDEIGAHFSVLCSEWLAASEGLLRFVEKQYNDKAFGHVVEYRDLKKVLHKTPVAEVLLHVFNHGTYHRGQLVTIMRAVGESKVPQTDFIQFVRAGGK